MHLTPSPLFQIRLEDDTLTMRGSQLESVGCVLRGQLVLAITEPTKFKEIKLTFQGISKVGWVDGSGKGQYLHNEERILYQHSWSFLPAKKQQYHVLKPDNYHWDFELVLPGTLPETIEGCPHGNIKYMLKAVAERHTFALNLHTRRKVTLVRSLLPSSLEYLQTAVVASTWTNRVDYEFSVDSKVFCLGDKIPVTINLSSLEDNLKVQSILCIFKEYVTYTIGTNQKIDSKTIDNINQYNFSQDSDSWNNVMEISIPNNLNRCLHDSQNDTIRIDHKLKFYVNLVNKTNGRLCELRASLPIIIASVSPDGDMNLPAYNAYDNDNININNNNCINNNYNYNNNNSNNSLYDNYDFSDKFSNDSRSISLSSSPSSSFSSFDNISIYEIQEDMSKLPSYRSIASSIPVPLADSLLPPTYDSLI